jgi:hypothetical protein
MVTYFYYFVKTLNDIKLSAGTNRLQRKGLMDSYLPAITSFHICRLLACKTQCNLEVVMKKSFRLFALSVVVLAALGFSAVGAKALTPVTPTETATASVTPDVGTPTATDIAGTETAEPEDITSSVEPVETEIASPDKSSSGGQHESNLEQSGGNSGQDSGNGSSQDMSGSNTSQDSNNGSNHDSGSGSGNSSGNSGN